ncbi:MAG: tRNA pseudouridine(13) synthase TruD [Thermoplasmata archaeon]|nr:tRNA pseudouridine(13) synthase TruD [Thermoplasmata archaeon]
MSVGRWQPPSTDLALGLGFYASSTEPLAGTLKARAEEFRVREISSYPVPDEQGPYTVLRIVSRNWEQHELGQRIASRLGLPPHAIAWAGTKDRRAVTERLASYRGLPPGGELGLRDVEVVESYRARDGLVLGHHYGNVFTLRLGGLADPALAEESIRTTGREIAEAGGFPNLFGPQRFGEVRPVTHAVGRALVREGAKEAVEAYLSAVPEGPDSMGGEARRAYALHHDPVKALRDFPPHFRFERQLLDHLARGHSPERALRALSRELRQLFVHAYQALIFNRWTSDRHAAGISLTEPEAGDWLLRVARDGTLPGTQAVPVEQDNLSEARQMVQKGRARLAGPLVGFETPESVGRPGEILSKILTEEQVTRKAFELPATPEVASRGTWRPVLVPMPPVGCSREDPEPGASVPSGTSDGLWLTFALPKGAYATVLLREFVKAGATRFLD